MILQKQTRKRHRILVGYIFLYFCISCGSDDGTPLEQEEINLQDALLTDFPLAEIDYLSIEIAQPTIEDNEEIEEGEIRINLPHSSSSHLTLESVNIDLEEFDVFPSVGSQELFSETEPVRYTITSKIDTEKRIHYDVVISIAPTLEDQELSISGFELMDNDSSSIAPLTLIKESTLQTVDSLIVCLFPIAVDFSAITPTIAYTGSKLEYRSNGEDFTDYVMDSGQRIDFAYPNTVDFKISNASNSESVVYRIVADTQHPIVFDEPDVILTDLEMGNNYNFNGATTWHNTGNYPISTMSPNEYIDVVTPLSYLTNIFTVSLSKTTGGNIYPGQEGITNVVITNAPIPGQYEATAIFNLNFNENSWELVNSPEDNYITNIGYQTIELKVIGIIVN